MSEVTFFSFLILLVVNIIYFHNLTAECQLQPQRADSSKGKDSIRKVTAIGG